MLYYSNEKDTPTPEEAAPRSPATCTRKTQEALPIMFDPDQMVAIEAMAIEEGITKGEAVRVLVGEALAMRQARQRKRKK